MVSITAKMPIMPLSVSSREGISVSGDQANFIALSINMACILLLSKHGFYKRYHKPAGYYAGDLAGHVCARGMHQQEVLVILLQAKLMHNTAGHREGGYARRANHGVHLVLEEKVEELCKQHAARGIEYERDKAERDYCKRFRRYEKLCLHLERNGYAKQQRYKIGKGFLRGFAKAAEHAAFPYKVAEHEEAYKLRALGGDGTRDHGYEYREQHARCAGYGAGAVRHADAAFLFAGEHLYYGRLYDGHERHV